MLSRSMLELAERNQWRTNPEEETVFGEFNGYFFTGLEGKNFKTFITPVAGISPGALQTLLRFLYDNRNQLKVLNYEVSDNFLCVRQKAGMSLTADKMEYLLAEISGLLALGELPTDACAVCGETAPKRGLYYGLFCHLHPECQNREMRDFTSPELAQNGETAENVETDEKVETDDKGENDEDTRSGGSAGPTGE